MNVHRIVGAPGVGKTTRLLELANQAAVKYGKDNVRVVAYTRAAAREAFDRADSRLEPTNVRTIHSICLAAVGGGSGHSDKKVKEFREYVDANSLRSRYYFEGDIEDIATIPKGVGDRNRVSNGESYFDVAQHLRQRLIPMEEWHDHKWITGELDTEFLVEWANVWNGWKKDNDYKDYTDWLEEVAADPKVLPPTKVLFVDEAQDLTPLQWKVIDGWDVPYKIVVGDDDQCLFSWSGSDSMLFSHKDATTAMESH